MKSKPLIPREFASRDVDALIDHYLSETAAQAALRFIDALEQAMPISVDTPPPSPRATPTS